MKLFYHLYGCLLLGMIALIGIDEYLGFQAEVVQYEEDMVSNAVQLGKSLSGMVAHTWSESGKEKALELIDDAGRNGTITIRLVWPRLLLEASGLTATDRKKVEKMISGEIVSLKIRQPNNRQRCNTYVPIDLGQAKTGALELSQPMTPLKIFSRKMLVRASIITLLLALVSGLILYYFIDRKVRLPLNRLMAQARRIGQGDLRADATAPSNDELAQMSQTMNDMCSRLLIAHEKIKFEHNARLKTLEQLRFTERLSSFGVLSAEIAHELGTPLNVVDGRAKMILNEDLQKNEIEDCALIIRKQAERMTAIIRQLLDFTRRPKQHISSENLAFHVKQVFQLLYPMACKQHVSFHLHQEDDADVTFNADFSQLQQVLVNLLMNAIQAMPDGGKVHVNLANELLPTSSRESGIEQNYLKLRIEDEGVGIRAENLEHIFTPFFTTKTIGTGTGLGLSIADGIVKEHGGWIDIDRGTQKGACFTVYLPMKEQKK